MEDNIEPSDETELDNSTTTSQDIEPELNPQSFAETFSGDDSKYVGDKGWKTPSDMLKSYRELETFSSNRVSLPKDGDDEDSWKNLYSKLGKPESADKYEIEGVDEKLKPEIQELLYKNNVLPKDVKGLIEGYNQFIANRQKLNDELIAQNQQKDLDEVMSEWGEKATKNKEIARRGANLLELDEETLSVMEQSMGTKKFLKSMLKLGEAISEDSLVTGKKTSSTPQEFLGYEEFYKHLGD